MAPKEIVSPFIFHICFLATTLYTPMGYCTLCWLYVLCLVYSKHFFYMCRKSWIASFFLCVCCSVYYYFFKSVAHRPLLKEGTPGGGDPRRSPPPDTHPPTFPKPQTQAPPPLPTFKWTPSGPYFGRMVDSKNDQ